MATKGIGIFNHGFHCGGKFLRSGSNNQNIHVSLSKCKSSVLVQSLITRSFHSYEDKDPAPVYFNNDVQSLLKELTGKNYAKIFAKRHNEKPTLPPKYEFMTENMLKQAFFDLKHKAGKLLQMPPVLKLREDIDEIISSDPSVAGIDKYKTLFTDISPSAKNRDRLIVVRETNGDLKYADWEQRRRANAVYFPSPYRRVFKPKLFLQENVLDAINREEYKFILDNACLQLDPDDPDYQRVSGTTYDAVDSKDHYENIMSTRHFGPFCFYLTWNKCSDNLMHYFLEKEMFEEAVNLVKLYHRLHPNCVSVTLCNENTEPLNYIKTYIDNDSLQKGKVDIALKVYLETLEVRKGHNNLDINHEKNVAEASS